MRRLLCLVLMTGLTLISMGESADQLFSQFQRAHGSEKVNLANQLFAVLKGEETTDTLLHFSAHTRPATIDFYVYYLMGVAYNERSQYDSAYIYCRKALNYNNKDVDSEFYNDCLSTISVTLQRKGKFHEALAYQRKCYELDLKSGNKENISSSMNNLAAIYISTKQYEQAAEFAERAVEVEKQLGRDDKLAIRYGIASEALLHYGNPTKALDYATKAYNIDHSAGREEKAAVRLSQMANAYIELGQYRQARERLEKAIPVLERSTNLNSLSISHFQMGLLCHREGNDNQAVEHFNKALDICHQTGNRFVEKNTHKGIAEALQDTDPTRAYKHLERYAELSDSMYQDDTANMLSEFRAIYHNQETEQRNQLLSEENKAHKHQFRLSIIIFILAVALLVALLSVLYYVLRSKTKANEMMKRHQKMRLDFFTKVTHEFRTPLTVIIGLSDNIEEGRASSTEEVRKAASVIKRNGYHMQRLTNQLLDIAKIRSDHRDDIEWRHGDIVAYTETLVDSFMSLAKSRGVGLHYLPEQKSADIAFVPDYYNKIVYNLISNSLKFTNEGGNVMLVTSVGDERFLFTITDTGIGISEASLPHIFEEFYTGHDNPTRISVGVGLSLVKQVVDLVGGTIEVKSTEGKGSTFTVSLPIPANKNDYPLFEVDENTHQPESVDDIVDNTTDDHEENPTGTKILIVEDNSDVIEYIGSLFGSQYTVLYAKDGEKGLQVAQAQVPDLIISDLMMPGLDGFQLCEAVRSNDLLSHIPFIMVTAKSSEDDRIRSLRTGADAYLTKPFHANELLVWTERLISQRKMLRERFSQAMTSGQMTEANKLPDNEQAFLDRINAVVLEQMSTGNVDVETIASRLCLSSKQLRRKVYAITGETTVAYLMHLRLEKAREMLISQPNKSVSEIAMLCGFEEGGYFTKAFKQQYGVTPTQMRKQ